MDRGLYPFLPSWPNYGYTDMGPPTIPAEGMWVGLTDRENGDVWYVSFDPCWDGRVALVSADEIPLSKDISTRVYDPYDGPYIGAYGLRLGVRNGHLLFDDLPGNGGSLPAVFDNAGSRRLWLQLYATNHVNPNALASNPVILADDDGTPLMDDTGHFLVPDDYIPHVPNSPSEWTHLAYDGLPQFYFGLTDEFPFQFLVDDTGLVILTDDEGVPLVAETLSPIMYVALDHLTDHIILLDYLSVPNVVRSRLKVFPVFDGPPIGQSAFRFGLRQGHVYATTTTKQQVIIPTYAYDNRGRVDRAASFLPSYTFSPAGIADQLPDHVAYEIVNPIINECSSGLMEDDDLDIEEF